jgi:hypothetical protein
MLLYLSSGRWWIRKESGRPDRRRQLPQGWIRGSCCWLTACRLRHVVDQCRTEWTNSGWRTEPEILEDFLETCLRQLRCMNKQRNSLLCIPHDSSMANIVWSWASKNWKDDTDKGTVTVIQYKYLTIPSCQKKDVYKKFQEFSTR